jgi:hypothetical protein
MTDDTYYTAGFVAPQHARYRLWMSNTQGATEETSHHTKARTREQIRTWDARNMTATVVDAQSGETIYEGSALGFGR